MTNFINIDQLLTTEHRSTPPKASPEEIKTALAGLVGTVFTPGAPDKYFITNLLNPKQSKYYCLVLEKHQLTVGRHDDNRNTLIKYNLQSQEVIVNDKPMDGPFLLKFKRFVDHIISDLKQKKAILYRGKS